ncbi:energy transducer TonB [Bradyrhizobium nitroreducens]|uniref:energy transducer TonB n=1 Tax=Bradyrhizobium nitroreducens TaxID=709803 RepID=UPI00137500CA|nr:TonB family protein [Bradyrhizobium nitroreducens]
MLVSFVFSILLISHANDCAADPHQSHNDFVAAVRDGSSSPYLILLTTIDDRSGQAHTGCTPAPFLIGAIHIELWGRIDPRAAPDELKSRRAEAERTAIENTSHVFHFTNPAALLNAFPFPHDTRYARGCEAIARGLRARIADRSGQLLLGPFAKEPRIIWESCPATPSPESGLNELAMPTISLLIGPDGMPRETKVTASSGSPRLDEAVTAALLACRFEPRAIDDQPTPEATWFTIKIGKRWPFVGRN